MSHCGHGLAAHRRRAMSRLCLLERGHNRQTGNKAPLSQGILEAMKWLRSLMKPAMVIESEALRGRPKVIQIEDEHAVLGTPLLPPYPPGAELAEFAMGCFWGAERKFWVLPGVISTSVGYEGGFTPNPTYHEVCTGQTGHTETVRVVFDPAVIGYNELLKTFWESHDPTQGMAQGNDVGTQYRSAIFTHGGQQSLAEESKSVFEVELIARGYTPITTEVMPAKKFYFAEDYHQQYLHKNPNGYCGLGGTGVSCPIGIGQPAQSRDQG